MRTHGGLVFLSLLGCLGDNPNYRPGVGEKPEPEDLSEPLFDLAEAPPDLAGPIDPAGCEPGRRGCRTGGTFGTIHYSRACRDGTWIDDRRCPDGSECREGYCAPPRREGMFQGKACTRENDCFPLNSSSAFSCQPFVRDGVRIERFCAALIGIGTPGTICMPPAGSSCRSGFCDEVDRVRGGSTQNYCYRACKESNDCPYGASFTCETASITVEGLQYAESKSCVPRW